MGHPRHRIPDALRQRAFTVQEAAAAGISAGQLSRGPYESFTRGVWQARTRPPGGNPRDELLKLLPAVLEATSGAAASHVTAAMLLRLRLPRRLCTPRPIHLVSPDPSRLLRSTNVSAHRLVTGLNPIWLIEGLRTTGSARTVVDLAGLTSGRGPLLTDDTLVAILDGIISEHATGFRRGAPALRQRMLLEQDLVSLRGIRGVARVRRALERVRPAVDSPLETAVRLCLERHGLTGWVTDLELRAPAGGCVWPDLADPVHRLCLQVEGAHHDQREQRKRDIRRERITRAAGWTELRVTVDDLREPPWEVPDRRPPLIAMVRRARERAVVPPSVR